MPEEGRVNDGTQQLPETSRNALIRIADELRDGFTGKWVLHCKSGGVGELRREETYRPTDLKDEDGQRSG